MYIHQVELGFKFQHVDKGECLVIAKSKKTITIKHKFGTTKLTYKFGHANFYPSEF